MKRKHFIIAIVLGGGICLFQLVDNDSVKMSQIEPYSISEAAVAEVVQRKLMTDMESGIVIESSADVDEVSLPVLGEVMAEPVEVTEILEISVEEATAPILHLIPEWLLEFGDVRRERVEVAGNWVERVRSRYQWEDGSQVEVEVTDLGDEATRDQFKSLGFDIDLEEEDTAESFRAIYDGEHYVSNIEYDENDGSGFVQYIVAGRYLMEIQLENLAFESFQALEDRDGFLAELLKNAGVSAKVVNQ